MKKVLLGVLIVIKNATIIIPLLEGMIDALVNMIDQENRDSDLNRSLSHVDEKKISA